jgi:hypothetical protein
VLLFCNYSEIFFLSDIETDTFLVSGLQEPEPSEIQNGAENVECSNPWFPYPSKMARVKFEVSE